MESDLKINGIDHKLLHEIIGGALDNHNKRLAFLEKTRLTGWSCKRCVFWTVPDGENNLGLPGDSDKSTHGSCKHPKVGAYDGGGYDSGERKAPDAINSYESIGFGPDFGCIYFQYDSGKEKPKDEPSGAQIVHKPEVKPN